MADPSGQSDRSTSVRPLVFLLGVARSGTSWTANILDSHPHSVYRHEPIAKRMSPRVMGLFTQIIEQPETVTPTVRQQFVQALSQASGEQHIPPFFAKSHSPWPAKMHWLMWAMLRAMPCGLTRSVQRFFCTPSPKRDFALVIKDNAMATTMRAGLTLHAKVVFLVRHPCAVVASHLRGQSKGLMTPMNRSSFQAHHADLIEQLRIDPAELDRCDEAEAQAYNWLLQNCRAMQILGDDGHRAHWLVYEKLCSQPVEQTEAMFAFLGWQVTSQTRRYLDQSSQTGRDRSAVWQGKRRYFSDQRRADLNWQHPEQTLEPEVRDRVMAIAGKFPRMDFWD